MQRLEIQNTMQKKNARSIRTKAATFTAIALTLCLAGFGSAAQAATFTVTSTSDAGAGTLREAITNAQTDDVIVFDGSLDGQTISLTSYTNCLSTSEPASATCVPLATWPGTPPYVSQFGPSAFFISGKSITIDATENGATPNGVTITRGGSEKFRFFDVDGAAGSGLTLRGLTLSGGIAQGGSAERGGGALGAGGAIFNRGQLVIERSTLSGNQAIGGHGNLVSQYFSRGGAGAGANVVDGGRDGGGPNGGRAGANGENGGLGGLGGGGGFGAIGPELTAGGAGGGGGFGAGGGGGGYGSSGFGHLGNGGFGGFGGGGGYSGGSGGFGGGSGGFGDSGVGVGGYGGGGGGMGGALFNDGGTIVLTRVTLANNTAQGGGNYRGGSGFGGAVFNYNGSLSVTLSTLAGNIVFEGSGSTQIGNALGGAIYSLGDSASNCSAGGNVTCTTNGATLVMNGSIAYGSTTQTSDVVLDTRPPGIDSIQGTSTAQGISNLIGSVSTLNSTSRSGLGSVTTNPQLGLLQNNGGPTWTMLPVAGSEAIDALDSSVSCPAVDQRGVTRPQGVACDIGAVEIPAWALNVSVNGAGTVSAAPSSAASLGAVPIANCGATRGGQCQASFAPAAVAVLAATPSNGNAFAKWSGGACIGSTSKSCTVSMDASKSMTATFGRFSVNATAMPQGDYGTAYANRLGLSATGGVGPLSYSVSSSTPSGLTFDSATDTVSGEATLAPGTYTFSVAATDSNGAITLPTTVSVVIAKAAQTIAIASPLPTHVKVGDTYTVTTTSGPSNNALTLEASGACSIAGNTVTFNATGACTITAMQLGDTNYLDAVPATQTVTVAQAASGVNISSTPNPSQPGQAVTFTVSVALDTTKTAAQKTKAAPVPTGTVSISDNGTVLGSAPLVNGVASVSTQLLTTAGSHSIVATYSGDANYPATQSAAFIQTVASAVATPVPTLNEWALIGLTALLALFGASRTRRRSA